MAKTLRTCEFARLSWWCGHHMTHDPICMMCDEHKPRETPLLVDVLRIALQLLLVPLRNSEMPRYDRLAIGEAALARYYKEVGDDEETE